MIKAIVFDCFDVFIHDTLRFKIREHAAHDPEGGDALRAILHATDKGVLSRDESLEQMSELFGITKQALSDELNSHVTKNDALLEFAMTLKPDYKLAMLSNVRSRSRLDELFGEGELDKVFDTVVASGDVGMVKPEHAIYELTIEKLGVAPHETVMIDDILAYCDGARAVGMNAIQYLDNTQVQQDLETLIDRESQTD